MSIIRYSDFINENAHSKNVFIQKEPYETNSYFQSKYKIFICNNLNSYYIGDLRKFDTGKYLSYLTLDKFIKNHQQLNIEKNSIRPLNKEEKNVIEEELNKHYLASNLMLDTLSYRDELEKILNFSINL